MVVERHFDRPDVRNHYLYNPYLGIGVDALAPAKPATGVATSMPAQATPKAAAPELSAAQPVTPAAPSAAAATPIPGSQTAKQPEQKPIRDFSEPDEKN
jgi:hypothetical protein